MATNKSGHNSILNNPKETINKNIERKKPILDRDPQFFENVPLPSWIELSLIDSCNRSCSFCPKSNEDIAPNTYNKIQRPLVDKLYEDLNKINYKGAFSLCGYGEPLLYKDLEYLTKTLSVLGPIEIVTNGDTLNKNTLAYLYNLEISKLVISMYDGPEQILKFNDMIEESKVPEDFIILRDRWYSDKIDYGVKLTNRTGTVSVGNQPDVKNYKNSKCFYTAYQVMIDWNGDFFLCPQDWNRRVSMGNLMQKSFFDIWSGNMLTKFRRKLLSGSRDISPCNKCNADGTVHGHKHAISWSNFYKIKK